MFTKFRQVSIEHLQRVRHANRGRLLLRTPDPGQFRTWMFSNIQTSVSKTVHVSGLWISNISRYFYLTSYRVYREIFIRNKDWSIDLVPILSGRSNVNVLIDSQSRAKDPVMWVKYLRHDDEMLTTWYCSANGSFTRTRQIIWYRATVTLRVLHLNMVD